MVTDFLSVTKLSGDDVTKEQVECLSHRYYWAGKYCRDKDVLEATFGTGQEAGYLSSLACGYLSGDFSEEFLKIACFHYDERIAFQQFDAQEMPLVDDSLDVLILFEALYYIPSAERFGAQITEVGVHAGQLFDTNMSDVFFAELGMEKPAKNLDIHGGAHGEMTRRMLIEIERVLFAEKPGSVLVGGDTNSTLAGALETTKLHIPVAHVEAGLRSSNMAMPDDTNRILADRISSILFCPTNTAGQNLLNEGFKLPAATYSSNLTSRSFNPEPLIYNVGDVMYDVAMYHGVQIAEQGGILGSLVNSHRIKAGSYCLATIHRAENTDDPQRLKSIFDALLEFSKEVPVIIPLHPRTRKILESSEALSTIYDSRSLLLIDPVGDLDMVQLKKYAALIATDSAGVQKEAFFCGVPCVTLRDETEWVELVESAWNRLAPPVDAQKLVLVIKDALGDRGGCSLAPYGTGRAALSIFDKLSELS